MKKLGLALSGGGAKAFCYLGFIRGLEKNDIQIHSITAHSGAAVMLCYLESGLSDEEIIKEWTKFNYLKFIDIKAIRKGGICSYQKLYNYLQKYTNGKSLHDSKYESIILTSDLTNFFNPKKIVNMEGDLAHLAAVSSLVPPLFHLYDDNNVLLGDGGYTSVFSAEILRSIGAEVIVGLFPYALKSTKIPFSTFLSDLLRVNRALMAELKSYEAHEMPIDYEISDFDQRFGLNDYKLARAMYENGLKKADENIPKIRSLLENTKVPYNSQLESSVDTVYIMTESDSEAL